MRARTWKFQEHIAYAGPGSSPALGGSLAPISRPVSPVPSGPMPTLGDTSACTLPSFCPLPPDHLPQPCKPLLLCHSWPAMGSALSRMTQWPSFSSGSRKRGLGAPPGHALLVPRTLPYGMGWGQMRDRVGPSKVWGQERCWFPPKPPPPA